MAYTAPLALTDSGPTAGLLYAGSLTQYIDGVTVFPGASIPSAAHFQVLREYIKSMFQIDGATDQSWQKWLWATSVPGNMGDPFGFGHIKVPHIDTNGNFVSINSDAWVLSTNNFVQALGDSNTQWSPTNKGAWAVRPIWTGDPATKTCTDLSGNVYDIITIGNQKWLAQPYRGLYWGQNTANLLTKILAPSSAYAAGSSLKAYGTWNNI